MPDTVAQIAELTAQLAAMQAQFDAQISERASAMTAMQTQMTQMRRLQDSDAMMAMTDAFDAKIAGVEFAMTTMWLILCAALIFLMQCGFALLEAGCCRRENVSSILEKNMLDACIGGVVWYAIGWGIAYGDSAGGFIGTSDFFQSGFMETVGDDLIPSDKALNWFFQFTFAATSTTIVSGAMAERLYLGGYSIFCVLNVGLIYPVVVAWSWGGGWTNDIGAGYVDFAGSGIVHMVGGIGGLVGTAIIGPRTGRFDPNVDQTEFDPHNVVFVVLGTFLLWFGWFGFNCGSTLAMNEGAAYVAAQVAVNTVLSPAACGLTVTLFERFQTGRWNLCNMCSAVLAGLVGITSPCGNVHTWAAILIGFISAWIYMGAVRLCNRFKIDDPVQAFPVHGAAGIWGVIATALFDFGVGKNKIHGWYGFTPDIGADDAATAEIEFKSVGSLFAAQIVALLAIAIWTIVTIGAVFLGLKAAGLLRVSKHAESIGLDAEEFTPTRAYQAEKKKMIQVGSGKEQDV